MRRRIASALPLACVLSSGARAVAGEERGRSPDLASPASVCTPIAGGISLSEMKRPDELRLTSAESAQAVWMGTEALVWASWRDGPSLAGPRPGELDSFFAYAPATNTWRKVPSRALPHMGRPSFVWAAGRAILWGGIRESHITNEGVILDPATGTVAATSLAGAPIGRQYHSAVVVGGRMLVFGGGGGGGTNAWSCDGGLFDPVRNAWSPLAAPPAASCAWAAGARIVAASAERVAILFSEPSQPPRFRVAIYDVARSSWTEAPVFAPPGRLTFYDAGTFGPDGALYVVASADFPIGDATLFRIDAAGRFEAFAPACGPGPVVRVGDRVAVLGSGAACEVTLSERQCLLATRSLAFPNVRARQFTVVNDQLALAWGYGAGTVLRWGASSANVAPPIVGNVRGAAILATRGRCGGAMPPPWEPRIAETAANGFQLLIRRGTRNDDPKIVAEARTDADGLFAAQLGPGAYCIAGPGQREVKLKLPKGTDAGTAACLAAQNEKCMATFQVPASKAPRTPAAPVPVIVHIPNPCFGPCYHGPLPP